MLEASMATRVPCVDTVSCKSISMTISNSGGANISKQVLATITIVIARDAVDTISLVSCISTMIPATIEAVVFEVGKAIIRATCSEDIM